jgi:preprotein translocase subunit SecE
VVYRGGLENRFGVTPDGGSNPSPSAKTEEFRMKEYLPIIIGVGLAMGIFIFLCRRGAFLRISNYFRETQEELKKCTWPTWDELKGSTVVVVVAIAMLGAFTVGVDLLIAWVIQVIVV